MIDRLFHYYRKGARPFRTISILPERQAIQLMKALYMPDSVLWRRFGDPAAYMDLRRKVEIDLCLQFKKKGGCPKQDYPVYFVVGRPRWTVPASDSATMEVTEEIALPASIFTPEEISFTYPDSMMVPFLDRAGHRDESWPEWFGKVFTIVEMESLIAQEGLPVQGWRPDASPLQRYYIEAQVWNTKVLEDHLKEIGWEDGYSREP